LSDIRIYLYANCSSCRKADATLAASGQTYDRRDIFKQPLTAEEIRSLLAEIGKRPVDVLSRRSVPYRELELANRSVADDELVQLMSLHPALLRRPIVIAGDQSLIGYSQHALDDLIARTGEN
jgi:Spx/MgsR family transcriptional regulator